MNTTAFQDIDEYGWGIVAVEDNSGNENTKLKDDNHIAEDNCIGQG